MIALILNGGSSTYKLSCFKNDDANQLKRLWKGKLDWVSGFYQIIAEIPGGEKITFPSSNEILLGLKELIQTLWQGPTKIIDGLNDITVVGHRVVHGGLQFIAPVLINENVKKEIKKLIQIAPLHNPINLEGIELMERLFPSIPQIAVFDTTFHLTMDEIVKTYPIPYKWKEKGIQRYGFHGISHQYCAEQAQKLFMNDDPKFKMINCHLGNGASLCAIQNGKSIDTTMGMTPMEGLMMGTRSGSIDPGIMLYLMREENLTSQDLDQLLNFESGLRGICGLHDMREIKSKKESKTQLAIEMFVYRIKYFIGALTASLNGLDLLCFTGGIGEHDAEIRDLVCKGLSYLNLVLDMSKNQNCNGNQEISALESKVKVVVIETQEEWMIARACFQKT